MRHYIDIGTYNGELLEKAIDSFDKFDTYVGFEPVPELFKKVLKRFKKNLDVHIFNLAASTEDRDEVKFYICYCEEVGGCKGEGTEIGTGSTLLKNKVKGNIDKNKFIYVETIDFSKYIMDTFSKDDYIVLKIDIEGEEYNLLEHMIKTGAISYINKIYCEWHFHKMRGYKKNKKKFKKNHESIVLRLNNMGFDLKGDNLYDELDCIMRRNT